MYPTKEIKDQTESSSCILLSNKAGSLNCPPPSGEWFKSINRQGWRLKHEAWHILFIRTEMVEVNCDCSKQANTDEATKKCTAAKIKRVLNPPCSPFFILDGYPFSNSNIRHLIMFMRASQTEKTTWSWIPNPYMQNPERNPCHMASPYSSKALQLKSTEVPLSPLEIKYQALQAALCNQMFN